MRVEGQSTLLLLTEVEKESLERYVQSVAEAVNKARDEAGSMYAESVDLAREPVTFARYWVEHQWNIYQQERARLGLDWEITTSERTADGKEIVQGLRVFTNNLDRGTIDLSRASWSNGRGDRKSLWFDVLHDDGGRTSQNAERVATRFQGENA